MYKRYLSIHPRFCISYYNDRFPCLRIYNETCNQYLILSFKERNGSIGIRYIFYSSHREAFFLSTWNLLLIYAIGQKKILFPFVFYSFVIFLLYISYPWIFHYQPKFPKIFEYMYTIKSMMRQLSSKENEENNISLQWNNLLKDQEKYCVSIILTRFFHRSCFKGEDIIAVLCFQNVF